IAPSAVLRPLRPQVTSNVMLVRRKARSLKPNAAAVWDNLRAQEYERGDYANQGLLKKVG
ncbi:MAG: LysR family transcriptional regulator, partial [Pseudomonadota bacterium]